MEEHQQKNWFGRNWKWAVPSIGCLSLIIITVIFASTMVMKLTGLFKDSEPYQTGMETLTKNELVIEILGEPIETNGNIEGKVSYNNEDGNVDLKVPVKGPKGEATLIVIAEKKDGEWVYHIMEVSINDTNEKIDLLDKDEFE